MIIARMRRCLVHLLSVAGLLTVWCIAPPSVRAAGRAGGGNDGPTLGPDRHAAGDTVGVALAAVPTARPRARPAGAAPLAVASTYVVTSAGDSAGAGTLRHAITSANASPGADLITFAIAGGGLQTIHLTSPLPEILQPIVIDGTTQPGYAGTPIIELDGLGVGLNHSGLVLKGGNSTVRGLVINNFKASTGNGFGILIDVGGNNTIQGNYIGIDPTGTIPRANWNAGVAIFGTSSGNLIGGTTEADRNVLSGNSASGVAVAAGNAGFNVIQGNYIGVNASGMAQLGNGINGVYLNGSDNTVGGTTPGARNVIAGNTWPDVYIDVAGHRSIVKGNYIGTLASGTTTGFSVSNGVYLTNATQCVIGDTLPAGRNVVSGHVVPNVYLTGASATGNRVAGNYIGLDVTGQTALSTGSGMRIVGCPNTTVVGNVISGHPFRALSIENATATGNVVRGNLIGTNASGTVGVPNEVGLMIAGAPRNRIGGSAPGEGNVVSASTSHAILVRDAGAVGNRLIGNRVGTDVTGTWPIPNASHGIVLASSQDTVGGTDPGEGNTIAFGFGAGVWDSVGTANVIRGNSIFGNAGRGIDLFPKGLAVNDSLDLDNGANGLQNFPLLDSAVVVAGTTRIHGTLDTKPNASYLVDFYRNDTCDSTHFGEGRTWIGVAYAATDASGHAEFSHLVPSVIPASEYVTATATDLAGNTSEFSRCLCLQDSDGDGLPDCWEQAGWGLDVNSDGVVDLDLYGKGARPDHKDLFVEIDAMEGYTPPVSALQRVELAFDAAPPPGVSNPDQVSGVKLHYDVSDTTIGLRGLPNTWTDLASVKDTWFGSASDRASPNRKHILLAKHLVYRYGLWARTFGTDADTLRSGAGELSSGAGGDDFIVTLGSTGPDGWNRTKHPLVHAGTFMHELGHTLGLDHGGADDINYKPNYYSVMNYTWSVPMKWQVPGVDDTLAGSGSGWQLDYSVEALPDLDENHLDETAGLGVPPGVWPIVAVPYTDSLGKRRFARLQEGARADWSGDGVAANSDVAVDVNLIPADAASSPGETLAGFADWPYLVYDFRPSPAFTLSGPSPVANLIGAARPDMTYREYRALDELAPPQPGGHFVMDGQVDASVGLVASNAGLSLHARYVGGQLYVATQSASAQSADVFVLVATSPSALRSAPGGKAGQAGAWRAVLADPLAGGSPSWSNANGADLFMVAVDSAASVLEGVIDLELLTGASPTQLYVAVGRYATGAGGTLLAQAPPGNGDGNLDPDEYHALNVTADAPVAAPAHAGAIQLGLARPNPAFGVTRVRLTLPRSADVRATVEDIAGRRVARLIDRRLDAGVHELEWTPGTGERRPPAGVYFIVVRSGGERLTRRVVVLR